MVTGHLLPVGKQESRSPRSEPRPSSGREGGDGSVVRGMPCPSTAASRWGTSDLTTPFRAVARSEVGAARSGENRSNNI